LLVSGGHTELLLAEGHGRYRLLGITRDDSAGEAFDKVARVLGLGFPGGPEIQRAAQDADSAEPFTSPMLRDGTLDFSFSGLKTAVVRRYRDAAPPLPVPAVAAGFQQAVAEVLVTKALDAAERYGARGILVGGGVAANALLRQEMRRRARLPVLIPRPGLCTDNGAMIAAAAFYRAADGSPPVGAGMDRDAIPNLRLG
jgi:N6-L-threonylcarbamoyladenine synthase